MPSYILRDINASLWDQVKEKATKEQRQIKTLVESLLLAWLRGDTLKAQVEAAEMRKEWAWEHAAEVYHERDLLVRALSLLYPSHLMYRKGHQPAAGNPRKVVVCIHAPTGQMAWTIPETMRKSYDHLEITENDWDGHKTAIRTERLTELSGQGHKKEKP